MIPWRRKWQPTPVFLPEKSHRQRSLAGYSPCGHKSWTWVSNATTTTKQICRLPGISQQRWVYSELAENCSPRSATTVSHVQVPTQQGEETAFIEGKRGWESCSNKESVAFHWLSPCQKRNLFSSGWTLLFWQGVRAPPSDLFILFNWGFCLLIFRIILSTKYIAGSGKFSYPCFLFTSFFVCI